MLELERVSHINGRFKDEELLAKQLDIKRIFDQSTANRFLRKLNKWHINQLERALNGIIQDKGKFKEKGEICVDIDASDLTVFSHKYEGAKPGRNKKNKGKDSYQISAAYSEHQIVATHFESGNVHCSKSVYSIFYKSLKVLERIDLLRVDAGYISIEFLKWLLKQTISEDSDVKIKFLVACSGTADGVKKCKEYAENHPEKWIASKKNGQVIHLMDFKKVRLFKGYPEGVVRIILVKMNQKVKTCRKNRVRHKNKERIYAIATNLHKGFGAKKIFKKYHRRQNIELMFKELKNSFNVGKLPTGKMHGNYAYFLICCIAYNTGHYFKQEVLPKKYHNKTLKNIRMFFWEVPAFFTHTWEIYFNPSYKYIRTYRFIVFKLNYLIECLNYCNNST